jgi:hypothetical protein
VPAVCFCFTDALLAFVWQFQFPRAAKSLLCALAASG